MVTHTTLAILQRAGEALFAAQQAMAQEVQTGSQSVVNAVAAAPFSADADRAYSQLRTVARMAHELQALEEQLRTLYQGAVTLVQQDVQVLKALPLIGQQPVRSRTNAETDEAQDVAVKPAKAQRRGARASRRPKAPQKTKALQHSANDERVWAFLERKLSRAGWTLITHAAIAEGAGIPKGSIAVALKRLHRMGRIAEGDRGHYRLG